MNNNINIYTSQLFLTPRKSKEENIFIKNGDNISITYCEEDTLDMFDIQLNEAIGNSSSLFSLKRKLSTTILSIMSVMVIMFALISASIYEDFMKKVIFENSFGWSLADGISLIFIGLFFIGLVKVPSILDGEGSELKNLFQSWFNKDARRLKKLKIMLSTIDKNSTINFYNIDLVEKEHWIWRIVFDSVLEKFENINIYVRNDQVRTIIKKINPSRVKDIKINKNLENCPCCDVEFLLSDLEEKLYSMLQLSSSYIVDKNKNEKVFSLEFFEYIGKNSSNEIISGFQNFIQRSFSDFYFLSNNNKRQSTLTCNVKYKSLDDEQKKLAYYLRSRIEECVDCFEDPVSILILFYYVKDIVIDEKRIFLILEKFIDAVYKKQQYELIEQEWFKLAGEMFDSSKLVDFSLNNDSIYRKLSIKSLDKLMLLFERNGYFSQTLFIAKYLYEINPNRYSIDICSIYERMGKFDKAYDSLPICLHVKNNSKPSNIEIRYLQRKSWIVVSQRKLDKKDEGFECLKRLEELLFSHNHDNEPLWLWHYYNIKANYNEWDKEYDKAIENYKKCLVIPTLGGFEYGATFVNMAIAIRFKFLEGESKDIKIIDDCISVGKIGVELKQSVGDRDEMPVVLHNQVLNILYKNVYSNSKLDELKNAEKLSETGIKILDETKSVKKLGMLLIENFTCKELLKLDSTDEKYRLKKHWNYMDENEREQAYKIYELFKNTGKVEDLQLKI